MPDLEISPLLACLLAIAEEAMAPIREVYAREFAVDYKTPGDPVTAADHRANALIVERLTAAFPGVPIVAEESAPDTFEAVRRQAPRVFFVDPLDGTREFVARNGEFVVMIGVLDGDRPSAGVVASPVQATAWAGEVGAGAWAIDLESRHAHPLAVSSTAALNAGRLVVSRSHPDDIIDRAQAVLGVRQVDRLGSAGLKGAEIARGAADAYVAPFRAGMRWDACAPEAVVVAAGGRVSDAHGALLDYRSDRLDNDEGIVVSNGILHDEILARLAPVVRSP